MDDTCRASMYQYILEGRLSNLPPLVVIDKDGKKKEPYWRVAASNTEQDYSNVNTTSLALLSRFRHLEVEPQTDEILRYLLDHEDDERIIGYLKNYEEDLFPKVWDERLLDKKANPFPRLWEDASHLIKGVHDFTMIQYLVGSCVGPEVASRFVAYCKLTAEIDMAKIIANPSAQFKKIVARSDKASLLYSIISSLASRWYKREKRLTAKKVVEITTVMTENKVAEFAVAFLKLILKKRTTELTAINQFDKLLTKLGVYFDE